MKPINVLYLHSHDTGRYLQPYGHAVSTPNLQRLAEQGILFRQAFCANPTCSPSRACLLTGQSAHSNGMVGLAHRGFRMADMSRHIIHTLASRGYTSVLAGVQHIATGTKEKPAWQVIGYDRFLGETEHTEELAAEYLKSAPDAPFFLSVGFRRTHREFPDEHPEDDARYCLPPAPLPDTPETREDMARFKASVRGLDRQMGAVLEALDASGLADRTLVICTTDHGIAFPRMKCTLTDDGTGIMLIMRGPGGFEGGRVSDALISNIDVFPTLCEVLNIPIPAWVEGTSFLPVVRGEVDHVNDEIFGEVNYHASYEPKRMVRTRRWKYIRRFDGRTRPVLTNCDDGLSKDLWMTHGWGDMPPENEMLYDVIFDPHETRNLSKHPQYEDILGDMRQRLYLWMQRTADPLLKGKVPHPPEAHVNDPDGISPRVPTVPANSFDE